VRVADTVLETEKRFRKIAGHRELGTLKGTLEGRVFLRERSPITIDGEHLPA
jgi:hypothetical protein